MRFGFGDLVLTADGYYGIVIDRRGGYLVRLSSGVTEQVDPITLTGLGLRAGEFRTREDVVQASFHEIIKPDVEDIVTPKQFLTRIEG